MNNFPNFTTNLIIGAGAAGLMAAVQGCFAGKQMLVLEQNKNPGIKILASGGGRCNYTNLNVGLENFVGQNQHFARYALQEWTSQDTIDFFEQHGIVGKQKKLGQIFPDGKLARDVLGVFLDILARYNCPIICQAKVEIIEKIGEEFRVAVLIEGKQEFIHAKQVVVATGGLSFPQIGVSDLAYRMAEMHQMKITKLYPALVPLILAQPFEELSGVSLPVKVGVRVGKNEVIFEDDLLFTHVGLSGPAILQISSYWREGLPIWLNFLPHENIRVIIKANQGARKTLVGLLSSLLPKQVVKMVFQDILYEKDLGNLSNLELSFIECAIHQYEVIPLRTAGYAKAEVSLGGVDTDSLNPKTFESKTVKGLYFVGECLDVTGWLGGIIFNGLLLVG